MAKKKTKPDLVIPSSFDLGGLTWEVKFAEGLTEIGKCSCHEQLITLRYGLNEQAAQQAFFHELVHAILFSMGKMDHDEEYVDAFGVFLHQFAKTQEW